MKKSKRNYMDFLNADSGLSFAEYMGIDVPRLDIDGNKYRYYSRKARGDYKTTKAEAKASYKQALLNTRIKLTGKSNEISLDDLWPVCQSE